MTQTPTLLLARYAESTSPEKIPADVRDRAEQIILDGMASAFFCRRSVAGGLAARYAAQFGGAAESLIPGTRSCAPAPYVAMANGTAGPGEQVDGAHVAGGNPGAIIVHAAVAMAERQRASGAVLLDAVVLGYDIGVGALQACGGISVARSRYNLYAEFLCAIGAAVASSRILGLDAGRQCHAMSLVTFQINRLIAMYAEKRHISKSMCNGQYAFAGVSAALMSAVRLEGNEDILGSPHGLLDAWGIEGGRAALTRQLGADFAVIGDNIEFVNAGYPIHAAVEAAMTLVAKHKIATDAIASVHVGMPENAMRVVDNRDMHNILPAGYAERGPRARRTQSERILFAGRHERPGVRTHPRWGDARRRAGPAARSTQWSRLQRDDHNRERGQLLTTDRPSSRPQPARRGHEVGSVGEVARRSAGCRCRPYDRHRAPARTRRAYQGVDQRVRQMK